MVVPAVVVVEGVDEGENGEKKAKKIEMNQGGLEVQLAA